MAGTDSRFSATKFRSGIKFAMQMGFPEDTAQQITWQWTTERTFSKPDSGGLPFDWTAGQVTNAINVTDKIVDCAVKFTPSSTGNRVGGTTLGIMDTATAEVTMLDTDHDILTAHALAAGAIDPVTGGGRFPDQAVIDDAVYVVQFTAPPIGLFDVTVFQVTLQAIDES